MVPHDTTTVVSIVHVPTTAAAENMPAARLYPIFAELAGRDVLVVGGGAVATRKVAALLETGASITVGATMFSPELANWAENGRISLIFGKFAEDWLERQWLVVAATSDTAVNAAVAAFATRRRIWCNVVDDAELSSFQVPAVVDRSPLIVAISTSGAAPVLALAVAVGRHTAIGVGGARRAGFGNGCLSQAAAPEESRDAFDRASGRRCSSDCGCAAA